MKIVIPKKELESVLVKSIPFIEAKDNSMITSNILISLSDDTMSINATDYQMGLKTTLDVLGIVESGDAIVNGKKLLDTIKVLKDDNVTIETKKNDLHISQSRSKFKLSLFGDGEFPSFPKMDNKIDLSIDSQQMINAFREIAPSIDLNNPKHEFNGALIDIKSDGVNFVSSDMKRLSLVNVPGENDNELAIIVPRKAILEIQKLFFENVKIYCNDVYLIIEADKFMFFAKLVNGKFPEYQRIIPSEINHSVNIPKVSMIESIKQVQIVSDEITINISNNTMTFSAVNNFNDKSSTDMEIEYSGDDIVFAVNSKILLDFLNVIYNNEFTIQINDANLPFILESGDLKTIVMPIQL